MESPPLPRVIPPKSKKRVFPGGSSSYVNPEVVEISPPNSQGSKLKSLKQKQVIQYEVIDVDVDEDCGDIMIIDAKIETKYKGKEAVANFSPLGVGSAANIESLDGVQPSKKSCPSVSNNIISVDGFSADLPYCDDEYIDMYCEDLMYDDEYAVLQSCFDNMDIPPGVEASIPWFPDSGQNKKPVIANNSILPTTRTNVDTVGFPPGEVLPYSLLSPEADRKMSILKSSSSSETQGDLVSNNQKAERHPYWSFAEHIPNLLKKSAAMPSSSGWKSHTEKDGVRDPYGAESFKSQHFSGPSISKWKHFSSRTGYSKFHHRWGNKNSLITEPYIGGSYFSNSINEQVVNDSLPNSSEFIPMITAKFPPGLGGSISSWQDSPSTMSPPYISSPLHSSSFDLSDVVHSFSQTDVYPPSVPDPTKSASGPSTSQKCGSLDDILKKFDLFKKFDIVQDHSDHHYSHRGSSVRQPSKSWTKKIQEDWRSLEKDLPDKIFVRVYESRMDLLRAVIVGAEGTPYHDGLFFFDVFFPSTYPNVPPLVYYHSGGLRINPNLYNCGKVCLSLLNTWAGGPKEKWIPSASTMLQVLVSIQGLILNAKPFFNEPGYANMSGSASGEKSSQQYNENTFILSLKTMVYAMRRPPKHFEEFVVGHFCKRAHDILVACKAYMDGAQVGCLVKGGVQDVDEGDKSCSQSFKHSLVQYMSTLVSSLTQIGAKDCERFLPPPAQIGNRPVSAASMPTNPHFWWQSINYSGESEI